LAKYFDKFYHCVHCIDKPSAEPSPQKDEGHLSTKKKKLFSKNKKGHTQERSETTVLDPKRQKQIEARRLRRKKQKVKRFIHFL
jgi:hypothetical protein